MAVFRRADFEARVERVRRGALWQAIAGIMILAVGYPAVLALHVYGLLSSSMVRPLLAVVLVGFTVSMLLLALPFRRSIRRTGLTCPVCNKDLYATGLGSPGRYAVLESGKCPKCDTELLDASEVGARPRAPMTWGDKVQEGSLAALVVIGFVAFAYFGKQSVTLRRTEECARRYATARTGADSIRVNQSGFRRSSGTCEYYKP